MSRFRKTFRTVSVLVAGIAFVACSSTPHVPQLHPDEVATLRAASSYPDGAYRLEPGDTIQIRYPFHPERNQEQLIRPDGRIRASGIGAIVAAGHTARELEAVLVERASADLRDPEVVVSVANYAPKTVYIAGEVGRAGPVAYRKDLTPLQAIAEAGGFRNTARIEQVVLVRMTDRDGTTVSRTLDLETVLREGTPEPIDLAPHDVVYVPRTGIAEANIWVDQHFTQLFPFFRGAGGKMNVGQSR